MVFIYSSTGIFVAEKYNPAVEEEENKYGSVLKLQFDAVTKEIQLRGLATGKILGDVDYGEGPSLLESELVEKLTEYCILKSNPGSAIGQTVNGNLSVVGDVVCTQLLATSDRRLKNNIQEVEEDNLSELHTYSYTLAGKRRFGIMAQEAQEIPGLESLVDEQNGTLAVDYNGLCALLLAKVNSLERKLKTYIHQKNI